ncbi:hypothetical protein PVAP13_8KG058288 [Panicum virgatum]|uniref:Pentatricopeptide repeat-containing protein n=1 Tax=Panicum virgatum TaxID=38727 RepID=A0A8T0PJM2_PANVG|nr:hypothetical protein PVAP13_8KG058288 [Panicum virgatum]
MLPLIHSHGMHIVCSSLMEALNNGSQPERVLQLMKFMKQKQIPLNQKAYFEIIASCSMLREWKTASEIIEQLDSSLSSISVGTLNHLLNFLGTVQVIVCLKKQYSDDCFCICTELRNAYSSNLFTQILENIYETRSKSFTWDWAKRRPAPFPA